MPWPKKYNDKDIEVMEALRRRGLSYHQISGMMDIPMSSILFHTRHIEPEEDGHKEALAKVGELLAWLQPGVPFTQLPLPAGVIAYLQGLAPTPPPRTPAPQPQKAEEVDKQPEEKR